MVTNEKMLLRVQDGGYVMDVELEDQTEDVITLDSGAGLNVWPKCRSAGMTPKRAGIGMVAANGTPIACYGQRQVWLRGIRLEEDVPRRTRVANNSSH